ncbi:acetyl xylan esterase [Flagelloscypha sp. PMI_526]|nr:acetyl xylan esterase [Flagelloscypha sp. PMI_526]
MITALLPLVFLLARLVSGVAVWGQCGGINYNGSTVCDAGNTCVYFNDYYSQCQPSGAVTTTTTTTSGGTTPTSPVALPAVGYSQVTNFGSNPSNVGIYAYVPSGLSASPGLVVALHYCTGSASGYYSGTQWKAQADSKKNFIEWKMLGCLTNFQVSTAATLKHDGGSDSLGIANAVRYALNNWGVNSAKVFVTGSSSGAMMANVLAGAYPDLFKAAVAVAGVPYGCFATTDGSMWNSACANGQVTKTGADWAALVKTAYSGYSGSYPKFMAIHGTADTTLYYTNFGEEIKQWTSIWGVSSTPSSTVSNNPASGVTHTSYGSNVQGYSVAGGTHDVAFANIYETTQIAFFGL